MSGARSRRGPHGGSLDESPRGLPPPLMELLTNYLERLLWPPERPHHERASRWLTVARYAYALLRDFLRGDLSLRAMSLVYTTMFAIVPLLAFSFSLLQGLGFHRELEPLLNNFLAPLGPRSGELTQRIIEFVDNVNGSALRPQHRAVDLVRAVDGAEGRRQLQLRVEGGPAAQLRAAFQRVSRASCSSAPRS